MSLATHARLLDHVSSDVPWIADMARLAADIEAHKSKLDRCGEGLVGIRARLLGDAVPARSGALRVEPVSAVSMLRTPATIAKGEGR